MLRAFALLAVLALAPAALACNGDDGGDATATPRAPATVARTAGGSPTAGVTADATSALTPQPGVSAVITPTEDPAIELIDPVVNAVEAGDIPALEALLKLQPMECVATAQGAGGPPLCRAGEAAGTTVEVLPQSQCEGFFARRDELRFSENGVAGAKFYAVYRAVPALFPPGDYVVLFNRETQPGVLSALEFMVDTQGRVVGVYYGCGLDAAGQAQQQRLTDAIVPPR